jgi:small subunit ribosomal protein S6
MLTNFKGYLASGAKWHPIILNYFAWPFGRTGLPLPPKLFFNQSTGIMNNYELMVIFTPVLSDDDFKSAQAKYVSLIKENGGEITAESPWGLKSLAYPIQKKTTGLYWLLEYRAPSVLNEKLKIQLLRDEQVMRHMVVKLDKHAVEYSARKRSGVKEVVPQTEEA